MRSEYLFASLLQGVLIVPLLLTIHEMIVVRKQVNEYEIGFVVAIVQTFTMFAYHFKTGLYFFDVPKEGRSLLLLSSALYAASFILFIRSMSFLNPVIALICQHAGIQCSENLIRFVLQQQIVWQVIIAKVTLTLFLIVPGWIPETCLVEPPKTNKDHVD